MNRVVAQEILETLADDDPAAIRGRKDLLLVNGIMGNHRWVTSTLRRRMRPGWRILEIGAGDGALSRKFLAKGLCTAGQLHAMDLAGRPADWPQDAHWYQGDLFQNPIPDTEVVVANLFLHHFEDHQLGQLGRNLPDSVRCIIAAEPARYAFHKFQGALFSRLTGLHAITRFDMQVSIRAGFRGDELARALRLGPEWSCRARCTAFGAYRFEATRQTA